MNHPVIVISGPATAFANRPEARRLANELLRTGRKNGIRVQYEALLFKQYPTLTAFVGAATRRR